MRFGKNFVCALHAVEGGIGFDGDFGEEFEDDHLVDFVVFNEKDAFVLVAQPGGEFFKDLLLIDGDLLRAVLVAVEGLLAFLLWVEDEAEAGRLQRFEDKAKASVGDEGLVVVVRCLLHDLATLREVRDEHDGRG